MNIFSFVYLAVFLLAGFCIARRALPQAGLSVSIPLGCGFGVSLLAFVPACFAVVLGFRLPALLLPRWPFGWRGTALRSPVYRIRTPPLCGPVCYPWLLLPCTCCTPMCCIW